MKLLFDQNLSYKLCQKLGDFFPNSSHVRLLDLQNADDLVIWQLVRAEEFVLVSQDADFSDLATLYGPPPKVIWLRCGNQPTAFIERLLRRSFADIEEFAADPVAACLEVY